ncbi:PREDICTED: rho-related protein racC-like [Amphimedon queenslandica]|uniref:Roc domain-containing protein n=1 Tax=Amphimedon queenslandica TaxID=400682 RepID=A0AAN0IZ07_AMPQE|nr:PREDICTED: rho-related protein racC-like [Amphimedon queenslandica]|eukprot:XP_019849686.1 PREDICTED: rho-related protein racC-like [Amphimedon queenslandica]
MAEICPRLLKSNEPNSSTSAGSGMQAGTAQPPIPVIKCMTVGDEDSRKIKLLQRLSALITGKSHNNMRIFEGYSLKLESNRETGGFILSLWDVSGQEEYSLLRRQLYSEMNIFLICFALNNPESFRNIKETWYKEVKLRNPKAQVILVGTKLEKRIEEGGKEGGEYITRQQGLEMRQLLEARDYVEISYKTNEGLDEIRANISDYHHRQSTSANNWRNCSIL